MKLCTLYFSTTLCNFLTNTPQTVGTGGHTSAHRSPPGLCAQPPPVHAVHPWQQSLTWRGLRCEVSNNEKNSYWKEINSLAEWCTKNNLLLDVKKTKKPSIDYRKNEDKIHTPVYVGVTEVEQMNSFRLMGIGITESLSWISQISALITKTQKQLYFLRKLEKFSAFTEEQQKASWLETLQIGMGCARPRTGRLCSRWLKPPRTSLILLPSISDISEVRWLCRAQRILNTLPSNSLFTLLPSGKRYRSIHCHTTRL